MLSQLVERRSQAGPATLRPTTLISIQELQMKTMLKVLSLAVIMAASAPLALADTLSGGISLSGPGSFSISGGVGTLTVNEGPFTKNSVNSVNNAPFTDFFNATSSQITFDSFSTNEGTPAEIFNINLGTGEELTFTATGFSDLLPASGATAGSVKIDGTITVVNDGISTSASASGTLDFSENGGDMNFTEGTNTTPGNSVTTTPEPGSLFLLGTGLLTVVGAARRKFNA
jgi:hypothetical protein